MATEGEAVRHSSSRVYCPTRSKPAVISMIERWDCPHTVRFVLWCSLRDMGQCDEPCLSTPPGTTAADARSSGLQTVA